jgi:hypothetical protein
MQSLLSHHWHFITHSTFTELDSNFEGTSRLLAIVALHRHRLNLTQIHANYEVILYEHPNDAIKCEHRLVPLQP